VAAITARGVPCYSGSCSEIYLERAFDGTGLSPRERLPVAQALGETSLMFLVHPTLHEDAVVRTATIAREVIDAASA
jgi:dTDP-4-amino-4,6-dideoxygalactose transaminase